MTTMRNNNFGLDNNSTQPTLNAIPTGEISYRMQQRTQAAMQHSNYAIAGTIAYVAVNFLNAPFVFKTILQPIFAGSFAYLTGVNYGIANDIIGCHRSLPYFSLGHKPSQRSVVRSNDPTTVAIAWGFLATDALSILGAGTYAGVACIFSYKGREIDATVFPQLLFLSTLGLGAAVFCAQRKKRSLTTKMYDDVLKDKEHPWLNDYQRTRLERWVATDNDKLNYLTNRMQNRYGYMAMPIIVMYCLACFCQSLEDNNITSSANFACILGLVLSTTVAAAKIYFQNNRDKQTDINPYRLNFLNNKPSLEDDMIFNIIRTLKIR